MGRLASRLRASARNALEIARFGRLGEDYVAPFAIVDRGPHHRLRRYPSPDDAPVALLVPPLMLTAEIYDMAEDSSAVVSLAEHGVAPWVVDFGAPEREDGGMDRSLDDHIRAIVASIERIRAITKRDVHLLGYSQGGMFAYQTAAFLKGEGIASIVTFGSPVDIHKNLPAVRSDLTGAFVKTVFPLASTLLDRIEGLPGKLTSTAFKIVSSRKELEQRIDFLRSLHDRESIVKREARRRFLGGAGFVAWPGPAFRAFVDEFVVHNRMLSGGFVIDGRLVTLADITCPILAFVGTADEIARPATIRPIVDAAPHAKVEFVELHGAGHFGLVVGSKAMSATWPAVAEWVKHGVVPPPESLRAVDDEEDELDLVVEAATRGVKNAWRKLGDLLATANATVDTVRWQEPRLRRLASIEPETFVSASRELARRAKEAPDATFFLWRGRAFSYRDADTRVTNVARGLHSIGVRAGDRVGVWMASRPSLLSTTTALGRLGATAVVAPPDAARPAVEEAFATAGATRIIVDPEHVLDGAFVLGSGTRTFHNAFDLEKVDVSQLTIPTPDQGRARDVSMILLRPGSGRGPALRAMPVTNHRWALSAIGAAAVCTLEPADTVFCAVPLHHPTGILVSAGAALAGGARLALVEVDPNAADLAPKLLEEIRRAGATVVFYTGEMLRTLLHEKPSPSDRHLPVRLFAGSGMRKELAARIRERFGIDTIEFYAGTTHRAILADPSGEAPGSLGRVLPGSAEVMLVRAGTTRDAVEANEPGVLAVRQDDGEWLITNDVLRRDEAGRYWFVDSLSAFVDTPGGKVSLREREDALYTLPEVRLAVASVDDGQIVVRYTSPAPIPDERLPKLPHTRLERVDAIRLTEGFRPAPRAT
ncbi:MAG: alpha/beta fold hydrolase [Labilithrix sp.]